MQRSAALHYSQARRAASQPARQRRQAAKQAAQLPHLPTPAATCPAQLPSLAQPSPAAAHLNSLRSVSCFLAVQGMMPTCGHAAVKRGGSRSGSRRGNRAGRRVSTPAASSDPARAGSAPARRRQLGTPAAKHSGAAAAGGGGRRYGCLPWLRHTAAHQAHILWLQPFLFGPVVFHHGPHHHLRALAAAEVRDELRIGLQGTRRGLSRAREGGKGVGAGAVSQELGRGMPRGLPACPGCTRSMARGGATANRAMLLGRYGAVRGGTFSTRLIHAGQQEVNMGSGPGAWPCASPSPCPCLAAAHEPAAASCAAVSARQAAPRRCSSSVPAWRAQVGGRGGVGLVRVVAPRPLPAAFPPSSKGCPSQPYPPACLPFPRGRPTNLHPHPSTNTPQTSPHTPPTHLHHPHTPPTHLHAHTCNPHALHPPTPATPPRLTLLHDREVSREVGVEDVVEAQRALRRHHLPSLHRAWRQPQLLADRHPHAGRGLHHHDLRGWRKKKAQEGGGGGGGGGGDSGGGGPGGSDCGVVGSGGVGPRDAGGARAAGAEGLQTVVGCSRGVGVSVGHSRCEEPPGLPALAAPAQGERLSLSAGAEWGRGRRAQKGPEWSAGRRAAASPQPAPAAAAGPHTSRPPILATCPPSPRAATTPASPPPASPP